MAKKKIPCSLQKLPLHDSTMVKETPSLWKAFVLICAALAVVPFFIGVMSSRVISPNALLDHRNETRRNSIGNAPNKSPMVPVDSIPISDKTRDDYLKAVTRFQSEKDGSSDPFDGVQLVIHQNGVTEPCAVAVGDSNPMTFSTGLMETYEKMYGKVARKSGDSKEKVRLNKLSKHEFDNIFTSFVATYQIDRTSCAPNDPPPRLTSDIPALFDFCDMGEERTPILPDHNNLERNKGYLPCHFHTREGLRVTSLRQLSQLVRTKRLSRSEFTSTAACPEGDETCYFDSIDREVINLDLYAVPAARNFIFAPSYVGEIFELDHVSVPGALPVSLEVMSLSPRVFDVRNFYNLDEADDIVERALNEKSESHKIKRSSTGASGYNVNSQRTSENGFDTNGHTAMAVKKRAFEVLGFDEYTESFADGLQVLRYNQSTAYIPHLDWIDDDHKRERHDFDSSAKGTNRFGTILLYMTDLPENGGGETVFPKAWPSQDPQNNIVLDDALKLVRESGDVELFKKGSWQEKMVAQCKSKLSAKPARAKAVLFYSQTPGGERDKESLHGGCPVLHGQKWAANLWVWNGPRSGYQGSPVNQWVKDEEEANRKKGMNPPTPHVELQGQFFNKGNSLAEMYFENTFWAKFGPEDPPVYVNTYEGHTWNVKVEGKVVKTWVIDSRKGHLQKFHLN